MVSNKLNKQDPTLEEKENLEKNLKSIFGGIMRFTSKDDFGYISATLYTQGCNLRCKYCYNLDFLENKQNERLSVKEITTFLKKRIGLLDSIVICGGEPTLHDENLIKWLKFIKKLGYRIKLDTNGTNPEVIKKIINLVDFISIDFKATSKNFNNVTNRDKTLYSKTIESIKIITNSKIDYNVRTTIHSKLFTYEEIEQMKTILLDLGVQSWFIQKTIDVKTIEKLGHDSFNYDNFKKYQSDFKEFQILNNE